MKFGFVNFFGGVFCKWVVLITDVHSIYDFDCWEIAVSVNGNY